MRIIFVMGPACAGKSYYIKENFKDAVIIDLYDFQFYNMTTEDVIKSYEDTKNALINAIKNNNDKTIILEHTLLKSIRRKVYIDAVKEITDSEIEAILVNPSLEIIKERSAQRGVNFSDIEIKNMKNILETPTIEEGFSKVTIIS